MFRKKRKYHWPSDEEILQYIAWGTPDSTWPKDWNPDANYAINLAAVLAREVLVLRHDTGMLRNNINSLHQPENLSEVKT